MLTDQRFIDLCTSVIERPGASPEEVAKALICRADCYSFQNKLDLEVADLTRVIELDGAPALEVASAYFQRAFRKRSKASEMVSDYAEIVKLRNAPVEMLATVVVVLSGLFHSKHPIQPDGDTLTVPLHTRSAAYGQHLETVMASFTRVIEWADVKPDHKSQALCERGFCYVLQKEFERAHADFQQAASQAWSAKLSLEALGYYDFSRLRQLHFMAPSRF